MMDCAGSIVNILYKWNLTLFVLWCMWVCMYVQPHCSKYQYFIPSGGQIAFHCLYVYVWYMYMHIYHNLFAHVTVGHRGYFYLLGLVKSAICTCCLCICFKYLFSVLGENQQSCWFLW
jgi:hypothetical protein